MRFFSGITVDNFSRASGMRLHLWWFVKCGADNEKFHSHHHRGARAISFRKFRLIRTIDIQNFRVNR